MRRRRNGDSPIVRAVGLVKRFGDVVAVDGIELEIERGETFGLLGPNGAGKTSTMRMIACVSPVTEGTLSVDGLNVKSHSRAVRDRLGVVAQQDGLDPDLNVRENLIVHARYFGIRGETARRRADEMLEFFGLSGRATSAVDSLSGGLKRRLTIARAFLTYPELVILDEPTTGLDPQSRSRVWDRLADLKAAGVTIIMSTHYMEEASMLCDRLVIMDHGRILAQGVPDELVRDYAGPETAIVRPLPGYRAEVLGWLSERGHSFQDSGAVFSVTGSGGQRADLTELRHVTIFYRLSNLEDVFLNLTGRELRDE